MGRCGLCGTPGSVATNASPRLCVRSRALYILAKSWAPCTPPQDDFANGQACAVLYLTGLWAGSLVSVSKIVHHMKLNMKARLAPAAKGWRAGGRGGRHAKLTHARTAAQDFFFHVEEVQSQLRPGQPLAELKQVKEQYVIFTVFFKKWRDSFATLFPTGFVGSGMDEAEAKTLSFEIGWYLFLLAKLHAKRGIRRAPPPSTRSAKPCRLPHLPRQAPGSSLSHPARAPGRRHRQHLPPVGERRPSATRPPPRASQDRRRAGTRRLPLPPRPSPPPF